MSQISFFLAKIEILASYVHFDQNSEKLSVFTLDVEFCRFHIPKILVI